MDTPSLEDFEDKGIVCKVQLPLFTTEDEPQALVYSEDRETVNVQMPAHQIEHHDAFAGGEKKAFILCIPNWSDGTLFLGPTAAWENW